MVHTMGENPFFWLYASVYVLSADEHNVLLVGVWMLWLRPWVYVLRSALKGAKANASRLGVKCCVLLGGHWM